MGIGDTLASPFFQGLETGHSLINLCHSVRFNSPSYASMHTCMTYHQDGGHASCGSGHDHTLSARCMAVHVHNLHVGDGMAIGCSCSGWRGMGMYDEGHGSCDDAHEHTLSARCMAVHVRNLHVGDGMAIRWWWRGWCGWRDMVMYDGGHGSCDDAHEHTLSARSMAVHVHNLHVGDGMAIGWWCRGWCGMVMYDGGHGSCDNSHDHALSTQCMAVHVHNLHVEDGMAICSCRGWCGMGMLLADAT